MPSLPCQCSSESQQRSPPPGAALANLLLQEIINLLRMPSLAISSQSAVDGLFLSAEWLIQKLELLGWQSKSQSGGRMTRTPEQLQSLISPCEQCSSRWEDCSSQTLQLQGSILRRTDSSSGRANSVSWQKPQPCHLTCTYTLCAKQLLPATVSSSSRTAHTQNACKLKLSYKWKVLETSVTKTPDCAKNLGT